jgi:biopolymer transport protein ExbD
MIFTALAMAAAITMVQPPMLLVDMPSDRCSTPDSCQPGAFVRIAADGTLSINGERVETAQFIDQVRRYYSQDDRVAIVGDGNAPYGRLEQVLGMLKAGGFLKIGLVAPDDE